jgi:peptidoglycan/LPS O-acetylase OafA/YrhL
MRRSAAKATPIGEKIPFLEGLRGLAALYVVFGHLCSMADPSRLAGRPSQAPIWLQSLMAPFAYGHLAVAAFIVISGFCLQLSLYHKGTGRINNIASFFRRRARRILPPYYACLGFSLIVAVLVTQHEKGYPWALYLPVTPANVVAHLFLVHNLSQEWMYKINGVLWSIGLECQLYLLFPFMVLLMRKIGRIGLIAVSSLVSVAIVLWVPGAPKLYPWYLALFTLGMMAAHFAYRPNLKIGPVPGVALLIGWPAMYFCYRACSAGAPLYACDSWLGLGLACLMYAWTVRPSFILSKVFSWRVLVKLGAFSYSLYLMHHPIQQVVYALRPAFVQDEVSSLAYLTIIGLPIILALSKWFSNMFEQPFVSRQGATPESSKPKPTTVLRLPLRTFRRKKKKVVRKVVHIDAGAHPPTRNPSGSFSLGEREGTGS